MLEVLMYDFKANINDYLGQLPSHFPVRSLVDLIAFNEKNKGREMPYFGQDLSKNPSSVGRARKSGIGRPGPTASVWAKARA